MWRALHTQPSGGNTRQGSPKRSIQKMQKMFKKIRLFRNFLLRKKILFLQIFKIFYHANKCKLCHLHISPPLPSVAPPAVASGRWCGCGGPSRCPPARAHTRRSCRTGRGTSRSSWRRGGRSSARRCSAGSQWQPRFWGTGRGANGRPMQRVYPNVWLPIDGLVLHVLSSI